MLYTKIVKNPYNRGFRAKYECALSPDGTHLAYSILVYFYASFCADSEYKYRPLLPAINIDDFILINELEYVWSIHEDTDGTDGCDQEENPELSSIHHHGDKLPIFANLKLSWLIFVKNSSLEFEKKISLSIVTCPG